MSVENVSVSITECISEMEFISSIPKGHKPCYKTKSTIASDSWFVTARRRWNKEKGENGIIHVKEVLNSCDLHYRMCINNGDTKSMNQLMAALKNSVIGFDNLIETYKDQTNIGDQYKNCKDKVILLCNNINNYINKIKIIDTIVINQNEIDEKDVEDYYSEDGEYVWNFEIGTTEKNPMVHSLMVINTSNSYNNNQNIKNNKGFFNPSNIVCNK